MANQGGNRGGATQSVSLYNLYKNRSYTCNIDMLGNVFGEKYRKYALEKYKVT
jgi:hypothetical protein